jgi:NitT/TauT family transport system permease protein
LNILKQSSLSKWKIRFGEIRIFPARTAYFVSRASLLCLFILLVIAAFFVTKLLLQTGAKEWTLLGGMLSLTFLRVFTCLILGIAFALPLGLAIGLSEIWSRRLEPIIQIGASFPAPLLFPAVILILKYVGIPLGIGSIALMFLGSFWYILFNVVAGAKAMPSDLREVAASFALNRMQRFRWLHLPAVFPYLVTGLLTASGGAWNASIVSEYVMYKGTVLTTPGIGSSISLAAQNGNMPLLTASVFVLCVSVVLLNLTVWLRLYHYSEKRFAINY